MENTGYTMCIRIPEYTRAHSVNKITYIYIFIQYIWKYTDPYAIYIL